MDNRRVVKISKYLCRHLRHQPERLGLTLAPGGWVDVDVLLAACREHQFPLTRPELEEVVRRNDKGRLGFDDTGTRIRANQGHSVSIDLQLEATPPPDRLFHGTAEHNAASILADGLRKMGRHHVHLSMDLESARRVGSRHGIPVVFAIDARAMAEAGYEFYLSSNGVWLVEAVPPQFLKRWC